MIRRVVGSGFVLGCVFLVSACGRPDVTVKTPEGQAKVSTSGDGANFTVTGPKGEEVMSSGEGKITVKGKEGETFTLGENLTLPKSFPKDVPIYTGAKLTNIADTPKVQQVHFVSKDPLKNVADFYKDKLTKDGWVQENTFAAESTWTITSKKGERQCTVILNKGNEGVIGILTVE